MTQIFTTPRGTTVPGSVPIAGATPDTPLLGRLSLISPVVLKGLVRASDLATTSILGLAVAWSYVEGADPARNVSYSVAVAATSFLALAIFEVLGLYSVQIFPRVLQQLPRVLLGWTIASTILVAAVFFLKIGPEFSRAWVVLWFVAGAAALSAERIVLAAVTHRWARQGRFNRRAVVYGTGVITADIIAQIEADGDADILITGVFDDREDNRVVNIGRHARLGGLDDLVTFARRSRVDLVLVALPITAESRLVEVCRSLAVLPVDVKLPARASNLRFSPRTYSHVGTVATIDLLDKPIADWGTVAKWLFDKVIALAALTVLAPVLAIVALAVKLESRGPVLFRQKRYGFNNELIEVLKFRSMYTDRCDAAASRLVTRDDPRVTRVGRFIRKTSLDELPQLVNVLKGDLSLVGPRPHAVKAKAADRLYDEVVEGYFVRHKVKPGITGWAQINGWRGETDTSEKIQKRVEYDLYYIENWSLMLDLYILARTPFALLKSENAY
jgi:Undecaprenyl-phosphate glucose phosphotransferase